MNALAKYPDARRKENPSRTSKKAPRRKRTASELDALARALLHRGRAVDGWRNFAAEDEREAKVSFAANQARDNAQAVRTLATQIAALADRMEQHAREWEKELLVSEQTYGPAQDRAIALQDRSDRERRRWAAGKKRAR